MSMKISAWSRGAVLFGSVLATSQALAAFTPWTLDELRVQWKNDAVDVGYVDRMDNGDPLVGGAYTNSGVPTGTIGAYVATTRTGAPIKTGSESAGKLRFDWDDLPDSTFGGAVVGRSISYFLLTSTQYSTQTSTPLQNRGLWKGNDFMVEAVWDLVVPPQGQYARLRLWDSFPNHASNDLLDLNLLSINGELHVRSRILFPQPGQTDLDILLNMSSFIGDANQVGLRFRHEAGASTAMSGIAFYRDGVLRNSSDIGALPLFNGEDWTRVSFGVFGATAPIPEPSTYALMLLGVAAIGVAARRRRQTA